MVVRILAWVLDVSTRSICGLSRFDGKLSQLVTQHQSITWFLLEYLEVPHTDTVSSIDTSIIATQNAIIVIIGLKVSKRLQLLVL